ncbi:MAG TPA: hypothetical protein VGL08_09870 [Paraburkholderia sp.]|jgi:hypothetical protein
MYWNRSFTDLLRSGRPAYWGNWTLDPKVKPGAVGLVDPDSGEFTLVKDATPGVNPVVKSIPNQWKLSSTNVQRRESKVDLDGSGTDPETGTKITAGVEVAWEFGSVGSMASEFGIAHESYLSDMTLLSKPDTLKWLADQATAVGMNNGGNISQGFGVITGTIFANSGLNVGSQDNSSSFSITGSAGAVQDMLGGANAKGSFVSTNQTKSVDQHLWPFKAEQLAPAAVPIAYTFASFDGKLLIPNWITRLGALEIFFNNKPGCTYITNIDLGYDSPQGHKSEAFTLTGGISKTIGNIPLGATNIKVDVTFKGMVNSDHYSFSWPSPLGQWLTGRREIEMTGVWPGQTHATEK